MATPVEIMKIVEFAISNLTLTNLNAMADKIAVLNIRTEFLLDSVTRVIHNRALNDPNHTELYAQLCALVINDSRSKPPIKSNKTFLTFLVPKCRDLLYSYKPIANTSTTRGVIVAKCNPINIMIANCKFIGELFNRGVLLDQTMRSIIDELIVESGNVQVHCLCTILASIGPNLANIYNMKKIFDYLRWIESRGQSGELLKTMVNDIKNSHAKRPIHRDAWESIVEEQPSSSSEASADKVNTSAAPNENPPMGKIRECIDDCVDLLLNFSFRENNDYTDLLTPNIRSFLRHDQTSLVVFIIVAAVNTNRSECRKGAGKLLAKMVFTEQLPNYLVHLGFNKVIHDHCTRVLFPDIDNILSDIRTEYCKFCNIQL